MHDLQASLAAVPRQCAEGCVKITEDLDRYRTAIARARPDVIVETGTFSGKSALWFARAAPGCRIVTIDVTPCLDPETVDAWNDVPIRLIIGDTVSACVVDQVRSAIHETSAALGRPARVMVSLDSDHSASHVAAEIAAYGPLVTLGSYMVVEDGLLRWMPDDERRHYTGDPLDAIHALLEAEPHRWEIDIELEDRHPATQHPYGWLRRLL